MGKQSENQKRRSPGHRRPSPPAPHAVLMIGNDELDVISEGGDQITTPLEGIASLASYMQKVKFYNI